MTIPQTLLDDKDEGEASADNHAFHQQASQAAAALISQSEQLEGDDGKEYHDVRWVEIVPCRP